MWQPDDARVGILDATAAQTLRPWEIADGRLATGKCIGSGKFGVVHVGVLAATDASAPGGGTSHRVAVKMPATFAAAPNPGAGTDDLLEEAALISRFDHPNIVALAGVVTRGATCKIVLQLCERGSLQSVLRAAAAAWAHASDSERASDMSMHASTRFAFNIAVARDVAAGMVYLEEKRHIHRDLAARNILVHENGSCLIADFGLSRRLGVGDKDYYTVRSGGDIPLRWSAPEVVHGARYTTASDVWSFFVTMWEVWSEGARPYGPMADMLIDVKLERVAKGTEDPLQLLATPDQAAAPPGVREFYQGLQSMCFRADPSARATFRRLLEWTTQQQQQQQQQVPQQDTDAGQLYAPMEAGDDGGGLAELPPSFVHVNTDRKKAEAVLRQHGLSVGVFLLRAKPPSGFVLTMCVDDNAPKFANHLLQPGPYALRPCAAARARRCASIADARPLLTCFLSQETSMRQAARVTYYMSVCVWRLRTQRGCSSPMYLILARSLSGNPGLIIVPRTPACFRTQYRSMGHHASTCSTGSTSRSRAPPSPPPSNT